MSTTAMSGSPLLTIMASGRSWPRRWCWVMTTRVDEELLDAMQDSMLEAMIAAEESGSHDEQEGGPECTS